VQGFIRILFSDVQTGVNIDPKSQSSISPFKKVERR
jgi:hypothetical protein